MKTKIYILIFFTSFLFVGCINVPINARTASKYYDWGMEAEKNGDLTLARQNYSRAYINAQLGNLGPGPEAYILYDWARVTGYLGMFDDAEKGFNDVLMLIEKAEGKADNLRPPTLAELARLLHDTNQHEKAIPIYEKALIELEKHDVEKGDPMGFAVFLDDYSQSLRAADLVSRADEVAERVRLIQENNKDSSAKFIGRRYKNP